MRESNVPTTTAAMLPPPRPEVRLTGGPPAATRAGPPEVRLLSTEDHDRIAAGLTDIVVRRLFSAGLALEAGVGLMGHHRMGGTVREAIGELDLAVRDLRDMVFDHHRPDLPASGAMGPLRRPHRPLSYGIPARVQGNAPRRRPLNPAPVALAAAGSGADHAGPSAGKDRRMASALS